jgi:hypothetical protein
VNLRSDPKLEQGVRWLLEALKSAQTQLGRDDKYIRHLERLDEATKRCWCRHCRELRLKAGREAEAPARPSTAEVIRLP